MKHSLKSEVLLPLFIIHLGIVSMVALIIAFVPSSPTVAFMLLGACLCTVGGTIVLWKFVVGELASIRKFREVMKNGNAEEWYSDRDDELGELEQEMFSMSFKKTA